MTLGVKESVSGKRFALTANGDEVRVCGGKGAVYLSGNKLALRCCGKTSIVVTKKMKQSVLRQGDVTLLEARDMFYANGTLTKYSVIDVDAIAAAGQGVALTDASTFIKPNASKAAAHTRLAPAAAPVAQTTAATATAPATSSKVVSAYFRKPEAGVKPSPGASNGAVVAKSSSSVVSPQDVSDIVSTASASKAATAPTASLTATKKRLASVMVDDDVSSDGSSEEEEEEIVRSGSRHTKKSKFRAIVESDDDAYDSESDKDAAAGHDAQDAIAIDSDVSSPRNDGSSSKVQLKQERSSGAAQWMAAYAKGSRDRSASGWRSVSDLKDKRASNDRKAPPSSASTSKAWRKLQVQSDDDELEDEQQARTHDEVGQLLHECAQIAKTLRETIQSWSTGTSSAAPTSLDDDDDDEQMSIAAIASDGASDRRIVTQDDIPHLCETLVLKPYQVVGVNWLLLLCQNGVSGVLADEMGLGKTVQTIAFLQLLDHLAKTQHDAPNAAGPHLVVVPASVLNNWKREFAWIAPKLRVVVYHGGKDERYDLHDSLTPDVCDVLLTTYSYFERDSCQDERAFLRSFHFGYMILDEGHSIKNAKTSRFKRISQMRTRTRLVLSGTPIQNSLNELLALLSFLQPRMFDHGSDELMSFFDGSEQKKCAKVRKILAPFILRREKANVLQQLVPKTVHVQMLALPDAQRKAYDGVIAAVIAQKESDAARLADARARQKVDKRKVNRQVQALLGLDDDRAPKPQKVTAPKGTKGATLDVVTRLRKAANHPMLLRNHYTDDDTLATLSRCLHRAEAFGTQCTIAMVRKELETYSDFALHDLCVQYSGSDELRKFQLPMETLLTSSKFDYLRTLLPTLRADGHRVLIFSQWTKVLDLLEVLMSHMDYRYLRLDGSTDVAERQGLIDTYNEDTGIFVFLLSTRAGGLGINLTAADTVILHDLDFNPTNDEQACDRCHRIGQTKPVTIYKLVAENTVDHEIYKLGETKTQLNHAVLGKLNAHAPKKSAGRASALDSSTLEMMLASVISNYQKS